MALTPKAGWGGTFQVHRSPFRLGLRIYHWGLLIKVPGFRAHGFGPSDDPSAHA